MNSIFAGINAGKLIYVINTKSVDKVIKIAIRMLKTLKSLYKHIE